MVERSSHTHKLNVLQNKIVKTVFVEQISKIQRFYTFVETLNSNFILECNNSDFELIREIDLMCNVNSTNFTNNLCN